jgi:cullin 3
MSIQVGNTNSVCLIFQVAEQVAVSPDNQLLQEVCEQWKQHQVTMTMVRDILMYMDRTLGSVSS